jgi:hypothetical protein
MEAVAIAVSMVLVAIVAANMGVHLERRRWNELIKEGILPPPTNHVDDREFPTQVIIQCSPADWPEEYERWIVEFSATHQYDDWFWYVERVHHHGYSHYITIGWDVVHD